MPSLAFSAGDRADLRRLGLISTQIAELETVALPICRAWLEPPAPMADVRKVLADTLAALKRTRTQLDRCIAPGTEAEKEAGTRLEVAIFDVAQADGNQPEWDLLVTTRETLARAISLFGAATSDLPATQRRSRNASAWPIARIEKALLDGWLKGQDLSKPLPPYTLRTSSSPTSQFRKVVGICYRTIGQTEDPERAIKAHIRWRKALVRRESEELRINVATDDSRRVRTRQGREPKE